MIYYEINRKNSDKTNVYNTGDLTGKPKVYPFVTTKFIESDYVDLVLKEGIWNNNRIIQNLPVLNYFSCVNPNGDNNYDWILLDVYYLIGSEVPISIEGFLCSPKLKNILSQFKLGYDFHFYPALLEYQGEFLDYFLFQYIDKSHQEVLWQKSKMKINDEMIETISSEFFFENYIQFRFKKTIEKLEAQITLKNYTDIMRTPKINIPIISEKLKETLENENITGLEFNQSILLDLNFVNKK